MSGLKTITFTVALVMQAFMAVEFVLCERFGRYPIVNIIDLRDPFFLRMPKARYNFYRDEPLCSDRDMYYFDTAKNPEDLEAFLYPSRRAPSPHVIYNKPKNEPAPKMEEDDGVYVSKVKLTPADQEKLESEAVQQECESYYAGQTGPEIKSLIKACVHSVLYHGKSWSKNVGG